MDWTPSVCPLVCPVPNVGEDRKTKIDGKPMLLME